MLLENEKLIRAISTHWMKYARPFMVLMILIPFSLFMLAVPVFFVTGVPALTQMLFFLGTILLTISVHWGMHRLLNESMVDVIITNKRMVYLRTQLLRTDTLKEVHMERIRSVEGEKRGIIQNLFGYGSLTINTEGLGLDVDTPVEYMPNPNEVSQIVINAMEEAIHSGSDDGGDSSYMA